MATLLARPCVPSSRSFSRRGIQTTVRERFGKLITRERDLHVEIAREKETARARALSLSRALFPSLSLSLARSLAIASRFVTIVRSFLGRPPSGPVAARDRACSTRLECGAGNMLTMNAPAEPSRTERSPARSHAARAGGLVFPARCSSDR